MAVLIKAHVRVLHLLVLRAGLRYSWMLMDKLENELRDILDKEEINEINQKKIAAKELI